MRAQEVNKGWKGLWTLWAVCRLCLLPWFKSSRRRSIRYLMRSHQNSTNLEKF